MIMDVYVASAFSKDNRGGNKAGVVLQQARLNEAEKTEIALLMGILYLCGRSSSVRSRHNRDFYCAAAFRAA